MTETQTKPVTLYASPGLIRNLRGLERNKALEPSRISAGVCAPSKLPPGLFSQRRKSGPQAVAMHLRDCLSSVAQYLKVPTVV